MGNQQFQLDAWRPDHDRHLDGLVEAYLASSNRSVTAGWVPETGETGASWLAGGLGQSLVRFVAVDANGSVVGHVGVGTMPDTWGHINLVGGRSGDYGELRRWLVHPRVAGTTVGDLLHDAAVRWTLSAGMKPIAGTFAGGSGASALARRGWLRRGSYTLATMRVGVDVWTLP